MSYFASYWSDYVSIGSTPLIILAQLFEIRGNDRKSVICCCFEMPVWGYVIILIIFAQMMMYPPWYGIFYNISAVIIGFAMPKKFITPEQ